MYLPAIAGHVPGDMVQCLAAFLDFCYLIRWNSICTYTLELITDTLDRFHYYCKVFIKTSIRVDVISLPWQHSLLHYIWSIILFGSPNGLCSLITESKHIQAVKKPWHQSSRYHALQQMLVTNMHQDKLAAARSVFTQKGMMQGSTMAYTAMSLQGNQPPPLPTIEEEGWDNHDTVTGPQVMNSVKLAATCRKSLMSSITIYSLLTTCLLECTYPKYLSELALYIDQPQLPALVRRFLFEQLTIMDDLDPMDILLDDCPQFNGHIFVYHSATARFYARSDLCSIGGMRHELIRSNPVWQGEYPHYNMVFITTTNSDHSGFMGMCVGRVYLFFLFVYEQIDYHCTLVHWFIPVGKLVHDKTGQWVVKPEFIGTGQNRCVNLAVVHADCIARGTLLSPIFGSGHIPDDLHFCASLDAFHTFFINNFADHHMHEFIPNFK